MESESGKWRRRRNKDVTGDHSAASFRYIPEEIILNVLGRLPIKSRGRFRCVSKQWFKWISHDIRRYKLLIRTADKDFGVISFNSMDQNMKLENLYCLPGKSDGDWSKMRMGNIMSSCNGLVLIEELRGSGFYLWNPSIGYYSQNLPHAPQLDDLHHDNRGVLGLCFDSNNGDYKVMMTSLSQDGSMMVGSFKIKAWTRINFPYKLVGFNMGVVVNDGIHWLAQNGYKSCQIICFDPKKDEFGDVPMPDKYRDSCHGSPKLCLLEGCLCTVCLIEYDYDGYSATFEISVMKEYGLKESWALLFKIKPGIVSFVEPLFYTYDEEMVLIDLGYIILACDRNGMLRHHNYNNSDSIVYEETFVRPAW